MKEFFKEHKFDFILNICFATFLLLNWFAGDIIKKVIVFITSFIGAITIVAILLYTINNLTKSKTFDKILKKLNLSYFTSVITFFFIIIAMYICLKFCIK